LAIALTSRKTGGEVMPYLTVAPTGDPGAPRIWIPERQSARWQERSIELPLRASWLREDGPTDEELNRLKQIPETMRSVYLKGLGADIGSVQRDGLFYVNLLESLKNSIGPNEPSNDKAADTVVDRMKKLGFASSSYSEKQGGPPEGESPRPWRKVLDWLLGLQAQVVQFFTNAAEIFRTLLDEFARRINTTPPAIAVGIFPPSIGLEFGTDIFLHPEMRAAYRTFVSSLTAEFKASFAQ
jgi:hypothetical protein